MKKGGDNFLDNNAILLSSSCSLIKLWNVALSKIKDQLSEGLLSVPWGRVMYQTWVTLLKA